jgi:CheY-like chemotaxis protein
MEEDVTILIVDDDADCCEMLATALAIEGYAAVTARSGEEALNALRGGCIPSLILLDFYMPGMNGDAFLRESRSMLRFKAVPAIMMTSDHLILDGAPSREANAVLRKPLRPEVVVGTIKGLLGIRSSRSRTSQS